MLQQLNQLKLFCHQFHFCRVTTFILEECFVNFLPIFEAKIALTLFSRKLFSDIAEAQDAHSDRPDDAHWLTRAVKDDVVAANRG